MGKFCCEISNRSQGMLLILAASQGVRHYCTLSVSTNRDTGPAGVPHIRAQHKCAAWAALGWQIDQQEGPGFVTFQGAQGVPYLGVG